MEAVILNAILWSIIHMGLTSFSLLLKRLRGLIFCLRCDSIVYVIDSSFKFIMIAG